jgi:hypothetical protein
MLQSQWWSSTGVDGQEFEDIEGYGVERWLDELAQELKNRTSTNACAAGVHTQAGREAAAVRSTRHPGPDSGNGSSFGS